jgi:DnaJ-class molecular chaperone
MTTDDTIDCPDCGGAGYGEVDYADMRGEHCTREVRCDRCDGEGAIPSPDAVVARARARVAHCEVRGSSASYREAELDLERALEDLNDHNHHRRTP